MNNNVNILVVEDDSAVRNLITTTLETHDYKYIKAANGKMALMEASTHNPDIILLDLGLPDMDGIEVIKRIRTWSNVPIIVISARSEDNDKIDALDSGADDYLTKPFSVDELLARLRVTQRRLSGMNNADHKEESEFTNGELKIDYAAGSAFMNGEEILNTSCCACWQKISARCLPIHLSLTTSGAAPLTAILLRSVFLWRPFVKSWTNAPQTVSSIFRPISA